MAADTGEQYTLGPSNWRKHARVDTKLTTMRGRSAHDTGGGYERIRSWEHDPTRPGDGKSDVYAYVHRLCAVAWCLPPTEEIPGDGFLHALDGMDVHHTTGVEWCNFGESPNFGPAELDGYQKGIAVMDHGRHSEVTQADMRAWGADAKRDVERERQTSLDERTADECADCGATGTLATTDALDARYCLDCVTERADGGTIEVL